MSETNFTRALSLRVKNRYAFRVPPPNLKKQAALWLGGALLFALLTVATALVFLPDFDILARHYPVL